jgi:hypothetical protein
MTVTPSLTTNYTLIAKNEEGKVEKDVTVEVSARRITRPEATEPRYPVIEDPVRSLAITDFSFYVAFNGTAMIHHVKIKNTSATAYKQVKVKVRYYSGAGIQISGDTKTLPITVPPKSEKTYLEGGFVVGVAPSDANARIEVVGAVPVINQ